MIIGIACTVVLGLAALWQVRQVVHWKLVARILGHDYALERAKRTALAICLGDVEAGLRRGDAGLCARAMSAALRVAKDDGDETIRKLGFKIPERPR